MSTALGPDDPWLNAGTVPETLFEPGLGATANAGATISTLQVPRGSAADVELDVADASPDAPATLKWAFESEGGGLERVGAFGCGGMWVWGRV